MPETIQHGPDWFDRLWDDYSHRVPLLFRNDTGKKMLRELAQLVIDALAVMAKTPDGVRQVVAYARIFAAVRGIQGVFSTPDPSPEEVATFVERLAQKVKP